MPKENIRDRSGEQAMYVAWDRERGVEVRAIRVASTLCASGVPDRTEYFDRDGLGVLLDRDGINRLIRSLRKARDQAFGPDA